MTVKKLGQRIHEAPNRRSEESESTISRAVGVGTGAGTNGSWYFSCQGYLDIGLLSHLSSSYLQELAKKCDQTATWWANTRDKLRDFGRSPNGKRNRGPFFPPCASR